MITSTQALTVARKTNGRCFYCNKPAEEIDHFVSKYWWNKWKLDSYCGSVDKLENLFPACMSCNRRKNSHSPEDFTGNSFKIWNRYFRANARVGIAVEKEYEPKIEPFNHYEWLWFLKDPRVYG